MHQKALLALADLTKTYQNGNRSIVVLDRVSFSVSSGETVAVVGPSGSGKSTLLGISAGLERPDSGSVLFLDQNLSGLSEDDLACIRNRHIGFVFQAFQLLPTLTAHENVAVPADLRGDTNSTERAAELLSRVGLSERASHYPSQLSGGEQQRVAIARAFINAPKLLFADEPTGNLDRKTAGQIVELLLELNEEKNCALIIATHDLELAAKLRRRIVLHSGQVVEDYLNADA